MKKSTLILLMSAIFFISTVTFASKLMPCQTKQCKTVFEKFKVSAKRGYPVAAATLAELYYYGYGTEKNEDLAIRYYRKAAHHEIISALYKLGLVFLSNAEHQNITRGIAYLKKAAVKNYKDANFLLGAIYLSSKFIPQDLTQADKYFSKAYKQQHVDIPSVIDYIHNSKKVTMNSFPRLSALYSKTPLVVDNKGISHWPDYMEVITVTSPPIESILNEQLLTARTPKVSVGTRFKNRPCSERIGCYSLKSMYELEDLSFLQVY